MNDAILTKEREARIEELYKIFQDEFQVKPEEKFTEENIGKLVDLALSREKLSKTLQQTVLEPLNVIFKSIFKIDNPGYLEYMNPPKK